jgi:VCBS repeat protein
VKHLLTYVRCPALLLCFLASAFGQQVAFERMEIDAAPPQDPWIKAVGDLDQDRYLDVIIGGRKGPLVWYRYANWKKFVIAEGGYNSVDAEAADVDGDDDLDLVVGGALWYENPRPDKSPETGPWTAHPIVKHTTHDVEVADLDGDGRVEVVLRGQSGFNHNEGHRILVCKRISPGQWKIHEIPCPEGEGLKLVRIDRDDDLDIVANGRWYENDGKWTEHVFADEWKHRDANIGIGDLNGDGREDIVLTPAEAAGGNYRISWFSNGRRPAGGPWQESIIAPIVESVAHGVAVADMNGDEMNDVIVSLMHQGQAPHEVAVYLNIDHGLRWEKQVISEAGSHNIIAVDLNGDGAVDVLGANHGGDYQPVEWWKNGGANR